MNKHTAKKLDKIDSKLLAIYEELENLLNDEIEVHLEKAEESEVQEIMEELDELRSRLQSVYIA